MIVLKDFKDKKVITSELHKKLYLTVDQPQMMAPMFREGFPLAGLTRSIWSIMVMVNIV